MKVLKKTPGRMVDSCWWGFFTAVFCHPFPFLFSFLGSRGWEGNTTLVGPFSVLSALQWSRRVWGKRTGEDKGNVSQRKGCIFTFTAGRLVLPMLETEWICEGVEGKTTKKQVGQTRHILKFIFVAEKKKTKTKNTQRRWQERLNWYGRLKTIP